MVRCAKNSRPHPLGLFSFGTVPDLDEAQRKRWRRGYNKEPEKRLGGGGY